MRVCDPECVVRIAAHAVWSRRRAILYVISAASLAGNFIVLAGSLELWGALVGFGLSFYGLLPQLLIELYELLMHRSVLYILLNLILVRILVKSGVLRRVPKPEDSLENYHIASKMQWSATFHVAAHALNEFPNMEIRLPAARESPAPTTSTLNVVVACTEPAVTCSLLAANSAVVPQGTAPALHGLKVDQKKEKCTEEAVASIKEPKAAQLKPDSTTFQQPKRASLFTIEPLEMVTDNPHGETQLVGGGQSSSDRDANTVQDALSKVGTRAAMLAVHDLLDCMEEPCGSHHVDENESLQVKTYDSDDNELNRQEFNQRVDTFICKFKRNLTMQRKDSLNRLLGLVGGDIRLMK